MKTKEQIINTIIDVVKEETGHDNVTAKTRPMSLPEIDSLDAIELVLYSEHKLGIVIDNNKVDPGYSIEELADIFFER